MARPHNLVFMRPARESLHAYVVGCSNRRDNLGGARRHLGPYVIQHLPGDHKRMADAHHVRRDPVTDEITWPPSRMAAVLRDLKLLDDKDPDT